MSHDPYANYPDDDTRWAAVTARNPEADGDFVYAVRTTGVYCRPSCPSRQARRANVRFFADPAAAQRAGFRACKRCRPDSPSARPEQGAAVARACVLLDEAALAGARSPSLATLATAVGWSPWHLQRVFKAQLGVTPKQYATARRTERVREALADGRSSVTETVYAAGYGSSGRFYAATDAMLGMTPSAFRAGGAGATIRFAVGTCTLGAILVAATELGVCAIALGDDPAALLEDLEDRFPAAELVGADAGFEATVAAAVGLVERPDGGLDLPLHVLGTAFQHRVWQALRAIPPGETRSYSDIASTLGAPRAARAVAAACAANPVALAIPCHRVVRRDGSLSGYRWGIARKAALLRHEAEHDRR